LYYLAELVTRGCNAAKQRTIFKLSDICRETALVVLGGFVIGNVLAPTINFGFTVFRITGYVILGFLSILFKKKGD